ncbi:MAG TPA: GAF domain-containing sensor histidine kinase [Gemmatimonadaceae bacterium]|nr:GAF domain-containing sensor histidine kinase [Gemmatimonadaceae bacterium]
MPRQTRILSHERFRATPPASDNVVRELMVVREIAHAFLHADRPQEVFQFALDRVSPLVGATLSCVYLVEGSSELMRLAASHNWPEKYRPWLGRMIVRIGFGPSGEAVAERRVIEVPDVFADKDLEDWQEVASELGFRSLVAIPLQTGNRVLGAIAFYYEGTGAQSADSRSLLRIVADQMAATAEKSALIDEMRRANHALLEANEELERQYAAVLEARRLKDQFLANISHELRTPLTAVLGYLSILQEELSGPLTEGQRKDLAQVKRSSEQLLALIEDLLELTSLKRGAAELVLEDIDPREVLAEALDAVDGRPAGVRVGIEGTAQILPLMRSDRNRIRKILSSLVSNAYKFTARGEVMGSADVRGDRVVYRVRDTGIGIPREALEFVFDEFRQVDGSETRHYGGSGLGLTLARQLARVLGGDLTVESMPGEGSTFTVELPLETLPAPTFRAPSGA